MSLLVMLVALLVIELVNQVSDWQPLVGVCSNSSHGLKCFLFYRSCFFQFWPKDATYFDSNC